MTTGRFESRMPGGDLIVTRLLAEQLDAVLDTLSEIEADVLRMTFGLDDDRPRNPTEIATFYGTSTNIIRKIQSKMMSKMRHEVRSGVLRDYLDGGQFPVIDRIRVHNLAARGLVQCPRHGWVQRETERKTERVCPHCPCPLVEPTDRGGRRRKYCSDACRQVAHRQRRAAAAS